AHPGRRDPRRPPPARREEERALARRDRLRPARARRRPARPRRRRRDRRAPPRADLRPDDGRRAMSQLAVVEASAGTGKTYFLEHRFVELVKGGASVDQILPVTSPEKATAELRARIRALLIAEKLDTALAQFDRAAIHTIHGFCQRVLVEDAFAGR